MVLKYIKSIWQSSSTSQVKTSLMTFISTTEEQLQDWKHLLKEGIGIIFIGLVNLTTVSLLLITSLAILFLILIYGLVTSLVKLVTRLSYWATQASSPIIWPNKPSHVKRLRSQIGACGCRICY